MISHEQLGAISSGSCDRLFLFFCFSFSLSLSLIWKLLGFWNGDGERNKEWSKKVIENILLRGFFTCLNRIFGCVWSITTYKSLNNSFFIRWDLFEWRSLTCFCFLSLSLSLSLSLPTFTFSCLFLLFDVTFFSFLFFPLLFVKFFFCFFFCFFWSTLRARTFNFA